MILLNDSHMASNSCLEEKYSRFSDQRAHFARIPRLFREKMVHLDQLSPPGVAMLKSPPNKLVPDCQSSGADKQDTRSSVINPCSPTRIQKIRIKYLYVTCNYVSLNITMHHYPSAPITVQGSNLTFELNSQMASICLGFTSHKRVSTSLGTSVQHKIKKKKCQKSCCYQTLIKTAYPRQSCVDCDRRFAFQDGGHLFFG